MKQKNSDYPIDFVITWVDGDDPEWQKEYCKYKGIEGDQRVSRFKDMGTLKYLFRGIEKFTPWVNKVFFATCGQRPAWLNVQHEKLVCIDHSAYMPSEYLPTFSSNTIELTQYLIPGLSEHFVSFNDDTFLVSPTSRDFFFQGGLPCDAAVMTYNPSTEFPIFFIPTVDVALINRNFQKRSVIKENFFKFFSMKYGKYLLRNIQFLPDKGFPGFRSFHVPVSYLKSTFEEVWDREYKFLNETCLHKFRMLTGANEWLMQDWQFCTGRFVPRNVKKGCFLQLTSNDSIRDAADRIVSGKYHLLCTNDGEVEDYDFLAQELSRAFETILPEKSGFEL